MILRCYTDAERCNGVNNCDDGYDEKQLWRQVED